MRGTPGQMPCMPAVGSSRGAGVRSPLLLVNPGAPAPPALLHAAARWCAAPLRTRRRRKGRSRGWRTFSRALARRVPRRCVAAAAPLGWLQGLCAGCRTCAAGGCPPPACPCLHHHAAASRRHRCVPSLAFACRRCPCLAQGTYEDMYDDEEEGEGQARFKAFSGGARTLAGAPAAAVVACAGSLQGAGGCGGGLQRSACYGCRLGCCLTLLLCCLPAAICAGGDVAPPAAAGAGGAARRERRAVKITFWANGVFTGTAAWGGGGGLQACPRCSGGRRK